MNIWHDIESSRITPYNFISVIEIPKNSKKKYELDKKTGLLILDRILYTSTHYPANYSFIPKTLADDGDPLVLVPCYPIGVISMIDNGKNDEKIIAIPFEDPSYNVYRSIEALPAHIFQEMQHFFRVYKQLEGKDTAVNEVQGFKAAVEIIEQCINNYKEKYGGDEADETASEE